MPAHVRTTHPISPGPNLSVTQTSETLKKHEDPTNSFNLTVSRTQGTRPSDTPTLPLITTPDPGDWVPSPISGVQAPATFLPQPQEARYLAPSNYLQ